MLKPSFVQHRISKSAAPAAGAPAKGEELFELTNITVKEVSLVDRPANQREFLVRKRDERRGRGWGKVPPKTQKADSDPMAAADADDVEKARIAREAEEKAQSERELAILAGTATTKNDPPAEEPPPGEKPADPPVKEQPEKPVDGDDKTEERQAPTPETGAGNADGSAAAPEGVAKVGRKMSKTRREKLKAIVAAASELLSEVEDEADEPASKASSEPAAPAAPAVGTPPVTSPAQSPTPDPTPPAPAPSVPVIDPPAAPPVKQPDPEVERLKAVVDQLQKMVVAQGALLAKSVAPVDSNAIDLEKSQFDSDKIPWPADLADRRERIKGRSF